MKTLSIGSLNHAPHHPQPWLQVNDWENRKKEEKTHTYFSPWLMPLFEPQSISSKNN